MMYLFIPLTILDVMSFNRLFAVLRWTKTGFMAEGVMVKVHNSTHFTVNCETVVHVCYC